jgi:hypothetical protein
VEQELITLPEYLEKIEDIKGVVRNRKSEKDDTYNG